MLRARLDGELVSIDMEHVPPEPGHVFVQASGRARTAVDASRLTLLGFDVA